MDHPDTTNRLSGVISGAAVQAGSITGDVYINVNTEATEPPPPCDPPADWTQCRELPVEVRALLKAQVHAAKELPYRLPGAKRPSLATVYVRQDLGSGTEEPLSDQPRPTPILDDRGQLVDPPSTPVIRMAVRPPARKVREALDGDDHLLVTGGPGQGKSMLSLRVAATVAEQWMSPDADTVPLAEPVVPLRLTARNLAARLALPFSDALMESARAEYGALFGTQLQSAVMRDRVVGCRWLLLVDGLDEVANAVERDRLVRVLAAWASEAESPYRVVLTTRPVEGAALAPLQQIGAARYELQPFDEKALRDFADSWFGSADIGYRFVRQIRAAHLDELVRVPLLATIAAIIFEERGSRPLPDNQYELYESYLKYLYTARPTTPSPYEAVRDALLEHLGLVRVAADTSLIEAAQDWVAHHLHDLTATWQEDLVTYLTSTGVLNHRGDDLSFLHHSFAEHLAATAKARELPAPFDPGHADFAGLLHAARPKERGSHARAVLLHYTRLHRTEADRLIAWLHTGGGEQHLLAARLLATHTPAGTEVVTAFLTTVRAWAMTTQHPCAEILAQSSRAAHHPGLAAWLTNLMRDEEAPWPSRIEAATALSTRLHGPHSTGAVALLRSVVDGGSVVGDRLTAAEALSDCGADERAASERGLRSVLADPTANARNCRTAAVVLASFDGPAREHAVEALTALLDDPCTPDDELAVAAAGLVEIGVEFHERCAEVFRTILDNRTSYSAGLRDAAIGLASLGPQQLNDTVAALTRLVTDRRIDRVYRVAIADIFAELGPQYRAAVGEHLLAISSEPGVSPSDQRRIAGSLAGVGRSDLAADLLRSVLTNKAHLFELRWVGQELADLGPEHHEEAARVLRDVADHPLASASDRAAALAHLATMGEPYRAPAIAALRAALVDTCAAPKDRCEAADELARLGPEFHDEVAEHVVEIASRHHDPTVRTVAWRALRNVGTRFRDQASAALLALMSPDERSTWESYRDNWVPSTVDVNDDDSLATTLVAVLHDPARSGKTRMEAAHVLTHLGRRFQRTALAGAIELLRAQIASDDALPFIASGFSYLGAGPRAEFAQALRAVASHPFATPTTVHHVAKAMEKLDCRFDPEIITAVRAVVFDNMTNPDERAEAAISLGRAVPDELADVVEVVLRRDTRSAYSWRRQVRELAALGADVAPRLRELLSDIDVKHSVREAAAEILAQLCPELRDKALAELRAQEGDEFLAPYWRTDLTLLLAQLDPTARNDAAAHCRAVLDDERQSVRIRCEAAYQLAQLDKSCSRLALTRLRRFATSQDLTIDERTDGAFWFAYLKPYQAPETVPVTLAVTRDPVATVWQRGYVGQWLWGAARLEMERSLLADRTASPSERIGRVNAWDHQPLGQEAEALLRDSLTAVDATPTERVQAAAALGKLAPRHRPEATRLLKDLSQGRCAAAEARTELAELSLAERRRMVTEAERVAADENRSWRDRAEAATLVMSLTTNPADHVVDYLRQVANDPRVAEYRRLEIRYALRSFDGLDQVRAFRDDERIPLAVRQKAANRLSEYDVADRAGGARVLNAIATNTSCRPPLRWRAARDLTFFGERGRELGVAALRTIVDDETLPVLVRVDAAHALVTARSNQRVAVMRLLRGLQNDPNPRVRIQVLKKIGRFDSLEGTLALGRLAADRTLSPAVRLRAATAMSELRRDYLGRAAVVAREVAFDGRTPRHIRVKAARKLARWSEPCRAEAQALLVELG